MSMATEIGSGIQPIQLSDMKPMYLFQTQTQTQTQPQPQARQTQARQTQTQPQARQTQPQTPSFIHHHPST